MNSSDNASDRTPVASTIAAWESNTAPITAPTMMPMSAWARPTMTPPKHTTDSTGHHRRLASRADRFIDATGPIPSDAMTGSPSA